MLKMLAKSCPSYVDQFHNLIILKDKRQAFQAKNLDVQILESPFPYTA